MKKYLKIMLLVLIVGFLTTGCMEEKVSMVINNDKSMDFSMNVSLDIKAMQDLANSFGGTNDEMTDEEYLNCLDENDGDSTNCLAPDSSSSDFDIDELQDSIDEGEIKKLEDKGYTVTQNVTSNKYELQVSKKFANIDDVSSNEDVTYNLDISNSEDTEENPQFFKIEKGFLENKYTLHIVNDEQTSDDSDSSFNIGNDSFDPSILSSMVDINFQLTLPNKSISNNATSISNDKKTLTWDLVSDENKDISVTFALPNENKNLIIYGGIGIGILLVLIIIIVVIKKMRKKNKNKENNVEPVNNQNINPGVPTVGPSPVEPQVNTMAQPNVGQINNQNINPGVPTVGPSPIEPQINTMAQPNVEQVNNQNINPEVPTVGPSPIEPQINTMTQPNVEQVNNQNINPEVPTVEPNLVEPQASPTTEENINADLQNLANDILNKPNE